MSKASPAQSDRAPRRLSRRALPLLLIAALILVPLAIHLATPPAWINVPAGTYTIGDPQQNQPLHSVPLDAYAIQRTEVTVADWIAYLNATQPDPPYMSPQVTRIDQRYHARIDPQHPVAHVTYADAQTYAAWLSRTHNRPHRLPTPAEWEVAALAGIPETSHPYPWGWGTPHGRAVWQTTATQPVGQYAPNAWGLLDMAGNVAEWCLDPTAAPDAPALGGSFAERSADLLVPARRTRFPRTYRGADVGFRLVQPTAPSR